MKVKEVRLESSDTVKTREKFFSNIFLVRFLVDLKYSTFEHGLDVPGRLPGEDVNWKYFHARSLVTNKACFLLEN